MSRHSEEGLAEHLSRSNYCFEKIDLFKLLIFWKFKYFLLFSNLASLSKWFNLDSLCNITQPNLLCTRTGIRRRKKFCYCIRHKKINQKLDGIFLMWDACNVPFPKTYVCEWVCICNSVFCVLICHWGSVTNRSH